MALIQIITKYIDIFFQLNGTIYYASIWITTQSWYNSIMAECMPFLGKYVIMIGRIKYGILTQHNMETTYHHSIMYSASKNLLIKTE